MHLVLEMIADDFDQRMEFFYAKGFSNLVHTLIIIYESNVRNDARITKAHPIYHYLITIEFFNFPNNIQSCYIYTTFYYQYLNTFI